MLGFITSVLPLSLSGARYCHGGVLRTSTVRIPLVCCSSSRPRETPLSEPQQQQQQQKDQQQQPIAPTAPSILSSSSSSSSSPSSISQSSPAAAPVPAPAPAPAPDPAAAPLRSALDDLPASLKLNAVAAAVAKQQDHDATLRVLTEMADQSIPLERSTQVAIVDSCVRDHARLSTLLTAVAPFGYGTIVNDASVSLLMSNRDSTATSAGTKTKPTNVPTAPVDPQRTLDLSVATAFVSVVSTALTVEVVEPALLHHSADEATAALVAVAVILAADRYALSAMLWQRLQAGLTRLFANDPARVALTDAAAFLIAYLLGLPWLCYRPDGRRAAQWHRMLGPLGSTVPQPSSSPSTSTSKSSSTSTEQPKYAMFDDRIVDKCLIWLVAPVAAELAVDATLINSNLWAARDFMTAVRRKDTQKRRLTIIESDTRIRTAISVASSLLSDYQQTHAALTDALLAGASVGECVSLISDRFADSVQTQAP